MHSQNKNTKPSPLPRAYLCLHPCAPWALGWGWEGGVTQDKDTYWPSPIPKSRWYLKDKVLESSDWYCVQSREPGMRKVILNNPQFKKRKKDMRLLLIHQLTFCWPSMSHLIFIALLICSVGSVCYTLVSQGCLVLGSRLEVCASSRERK